MIFILLTILGALLSGTQLTAMDTVTIVDHNNGESLPAEIQSDTLEIVFGATPRYSFFREYMNLLGKHLEELDAFYKKDKRLRGLQNRQAIKQQMDRLRQTNPKASIADLLRQLSFDDQCTLFFMIGFDRRKLNSNVTALCKQAANGGTFTFEGVEHHLMVHVLLPIYFDDCTTYNPSIETLHAFLQACARFYKTQYEQLIKKQNEQAKQDEKAKQDEQAKGAPHTILLYDEQAKQDEKAKGAPHTILLYIPPLKYFEEMLVLAQSGEVSPETKNALLATLIQDELITPVKKSQPIVFLNQDAEELQALMGRLAGNGIDPKSVRLSKLIIIDGSEETKSFTPYIIKVDETREVKTDYKTSPLLSPDALRFTIDRGAQ